MPSLATDAGQMEHAFARAEKGRTISREEALLLFECADLSALLAAACSLRQRRTNRVITYSKKVFIPLTRLCRDFCGYCTFRRSPGEAGDGFLSPDEVLAIAEAGHRAGCKEALFSLGDQPEKLFPEAAAQLRRMGFSRTLEYLAAMTELTLKRTGLLPHANPGVMEEADLRRLRESNASVGLMLECSSARLLRPGQAHWKAPDKVPALRLQTMETAGRLRMAFTTGILIGIGETIEERVDSLLAIREIHARHGHIQEVIVQNFRAKPGTRMESMPEPSFEDLLRTIAIARLLLGSEINVQAPPNLSYSEFPHLLDAGLNDWGGVSPVTRDHINPEAAWPDLELLQRETEGRGFQLRERLAIYPEFARRPEFLHEEMHRHVEELSSAEGYAQTQAN
jgi:FO synthase